MRLSYHKMTHKIPDTKGKCRNLGNMLHSVNKTTHSIRENLMGTQRQTHHEPKKFSTPQAPRKLLESPTLICGLGNPGEKYAHTRHNIGFAVIDALASRYDARYWKSKAGCLVTTIIVTDADAQRREVLLVKPQDFMNTSGGPLSKLARARHISPADILVVHDEVDLAAGSVRTRAGGGLNAHNGLRSIADKLGTRDFMRLQCGIGRPPGRMKVANYVLKELKGAALEEFFVTVEVAADEVEKLLKTSTQAAGTNGIKIERRL